MSHINNIVQQALNDNILDQGLTAIGVMDYPRLENTIRDLNQAFPAPFVHTFAVKANALVHVLQKIRTLGVGAEVASPGELLIAHESGYTSDQIIFDSPAKTHEDLLACISNNIALNIDNLQELTRVDALMAKYPESTSILGFRVNPQIGSGAISSTSTATATSKFGYALADGDNKQQLLNIYKNRPWLTSLHTHSGSQGCELSLMAQGIKAIVELAEQINEFVGFQQITQIDIGGGLPVNFSSEEVTPTFSEYAELLKRDVPELFTGKYRVKTEFGRAIVAKSGFIATRVEYTKSMGGRHIATTHAGAQILTRTAFLPDSWPLRVSIFAQDGTQRTDKNSLVVATDIAGPCCFSGDLVCKNIRLPKVEQNDYIVIHDTGGYYFTNHFDYNSLPRIAVYAYEEKTTGPSLSLIRQADTLSDVLSRM